MKNITLFTLQEKYAHGGTAHLSTLSLEKAFSRLLSNFIKNRDDSFILLETIVLSCIAVESIVREELKEINPALLLEKIDPVHVALISGKKEKLIENITLEASDIKTANISVLFDRYLKFYKKPRCQKGVKSLFDLRNKILHAAQDNVVDKHEITLLLTRSIFPFIKDYVKVSDIEWLKIRKIQKVAYSAFKAELVRKILFFEDIASKMTKDKKDSLNSEKFIENDDEVILTEDFLCPSCKSNSIVVIEGVDFDWNPDGMLANSYYTARCKVCEFELSSSEFEEIADNPSEYFSRKEQDSAWTNVIREREFDMTDISLDDI